MPRRHVLTPEERTGLLAFPTSDVGLIQHYTLSASDIAIIRQRRGDPNRFGFATQLCYLRYPGIVMPPKADPPSALLTMIGQQLRLDPRLWREYAERAETRREHLAELQAWLSIRPFSKEHAQQAVHHLTDLASQTDRGMVLAEAAIAFLRAERIIIPAIDVLERICSEARTFGTRHVYATLTTPLSAKHRQDLDQLLSKRDGMPHSSLMWARQPPGPPRPMHILRHLARLQALHNLGLPEGLEQAVHQNRLLKLAREGGQMTAQHLRDLEPSRRYATLVAVVLDARATLTDEIIDLHDHILGSLFSRAKRTHAEQFQESGKSINEKVRMYTRIGRALLDAKQAGSDPFAAIERIMPWSAFSKSITEAEHLVQPDDFDFLPLIINGFNQLRRYTPILLEALRLQAAPAARSLVAAVEVLKAMNRSPARTVKVPVDAPRSFVRKRWKALVHTTKGLDRRFYELCVLFELRNALRSGDIWVQGSRQFKDFEAYLMPVPRFTTQRDEQRLGLAVDTDCTLFLEARCAALDRELAAAERLAAADELPDATFSGGRLSISPLTNAVPEEAAALMQQVYSLMPRLKITELLLEVDGWTTFTRQFTHLKSGSCADDQRMLLTTILADAVNLGLRKMTEACPGTTYAKLTWLQAWYVRDETYAAALAMLVNA